ncbi:MAG: zinc-ribbon domain-containing protein [Roseburia sp.]
MQCTNCNSQIPDDSAICPRCGIPLQQNPNPAQPNPQFNQNFEQQNSQFSQNYGQQNSQFSQNYGQQNSQFYQTQGYGQPYGFTQPGMTKSQFYRCPEAKSYRTNILICSICLYICAAFTLIFTILTANVFNILDVMLIIGLTLGIHLGKSRACAIVMLVYSIFSVIVGLLVYGQLMGWFTVIIAIYATVTTCMYQSAWKKYQRTGVISSM